MTIQIEPHPLIAITSFQIDLRTPLGGIESPDWLVALLDADAATPFGYDESVRAAIRDLFRAGGYRPTGRGKPASEYLHTAAINGRLGSINAAVDLCNVVSLHSQLPISLVDVVKLETPLAIGLPGSRTAYVFNASGQEIDITGLISLRDAGGWCANGVKDSQRTKTNGATQRTLTVIWGRVDLAERLVTATDWYHELAARLGWILVTE